ncbi:MAG: NAD(P)-dependent oxidoreductase, partial [Pseudomonadota bacterium]
MVTSKHSSSVHRVGVIGTGFVARHFCQELVHRSNYALTKVLTRRPIDSVDFPIQGVLTNEIDEVIETSDIIFECTGDVHFATETIAAAIEAGRKVVTLNPEFHVTTGSWFVGRGFLTEADGDQPGCQASLVEEAEAMGFEAIVLGNMKGFLNRVPDPEEMKFWAGKQGISMPMVTSFTDGTKLQFEQALVGNYFAAGIAQDELIGPETDDLAEAATILGDAATAQGRPITDYVLSRKLPHGVFVIAKHKGEQKDALRYLKLGEGPYYTLMRNNIFVHLEVFRTLDRITRGGGVLLDNAAVPEIGVATIAKRRVEAGTHIKRGAGSFDVRGICVRIADHPGHLPIGLADDIRLKHSVEPGQPITMSDVEIPPARQGFAFR